MVRNTRHHHAHTHQQAVFTVSSTPNPPPPPSETVHHVTPRPTNQLSQWRHLGGKQKASGGVKACARAMRAWEPEPSKIKRTCTAAGSGKADLPRAALSPRHCRPSKMSHGHATSSRLHAMPPCHTTQRLHHAIHAFTTNRRL